MDKQTVAEINLIDLLFYIKKRLWIVLVSGAVCALATLLVNAIVLTPQYTASTRIYVLNRASDAGIDYSDIQSSAQLAQDFEVLITGRNVTSQVIRQLSLDMTDGQLADKITINGVTDSRILQIDVMDSDAKRAADIANCVREVAKEQLVNIMEIDTVNVVYEAEQPVNPSAPHTKRNTILALMLGVCISCLALIVLFIVDDSVKTEEEIERYLNLSTVGVIPHSNSILKANQTRSKKRQVRGKKA